MRFAVLVAWVGAGLLEGCKKQTTGQSAPQGGSKGADSSNLQQGRTSKSSRKTGGGGPPQSGDEPPVVDSPSLPASETKKKQVKQVIAQIKENPAEVGHYMIPGMTEEEAIRLAVELSLENGAAASNLAASAPAVKVPGRVGVPNQGNTCYLAAAVQLLTHAGPFKDRMLALSQDRFKSSPIAKEFDSLVRQTWDDGTRDLNVQPLRRLLASKRPAFFTPTGQHDAQEALAVVMEEIAAVAPDASRALEIEVEQTLESQKCHQRSANKVREHVFIVPLPDERDGDSYKLEDLIKQAQWPVDVDYTFEDTGCNDKHVGRSRRIVNTGEVLLVQLQRTTFRLGEYSKSFTRVQVPLTLNMGANRYRLTGVIYHGGPSMQGGHYTAEVLLDGNQWVDANDSQVSNRNAPLTGTDARDISARRLLNTPYVLLYQVAH